jgi:ribosomal protein S18 acetylase RimI-like enzyme
VSSDAPSRRGQQRIRAKPPAIEVRRLRLDDAELFRAVRLAALRDTPDAFGETLDEAEKSDWQARTVSGSSHTDRGVFVAVERDRGIGMVFAKGATPPEPAFLGGLWVHPAFRRFGVGRRLFQSATEFLRAADQGQLSLWAAGSAPGVFDFYRSLGLRETGATAALRQGSLVTIHEFVLTLT